MSTFSDLDYRLNTVNKDIKISQNIDAINNSLRNIVTTQKYSIPGLPDFGANIETALFEIIDDVTFDYIEELIREEVLRWETRVNIKQLLFTHDIDNGQILIKILYTIVQSDEIQSTTVIINT